MNNEDWYQNTERHQRWAIWFIVVCLVGLPVVAMVLRLVGG